MSSEPPFRPRIVLIAPPIDDAGRLGALFAAALDGGDVASVILSAHGRGLEAFQQLAAPVAALLQARGVAVMVEGDTRVAGRIGADGVHVDGGPSEIAAAVERFQPAMMVGANGGRTRHEALEIGEQRPDYVFFGRIGADTRPEPHRRNLALGQWWAEMVDLPCIVQAGSDVASVAAVAATGAEFVALSSAVFAEGRDPAAMIAEANRLLDRAALETAG